MIGTTTKENTLPDAVRRLLDEHAVLNFMLVGGMGYVINMGVYYPLTLLFRNETVVFGQHCYVPPFLISSYVAISSNYLMNRRWTFKTQEKSAGYLRYLGTYGFSLVFELAALVILTDFAHLSPQRSATTAILGIFLGRYAMVKRCVWKTAPGASEKQTGKV